MKPCKHGHVDGAMHIPCPECRVEYLEKRVRLLEEAIDSACGHLATGRKNLAEDILNVARLRLP